MIDPVDLAASSSPAPASPPPPARCSTCSRRRCSRSASRSTASPAASPDGPVENLVALRGSGAPHFGFAGHLDVVPPGEGWDGDPFEPRIEDGLLTGRGANDMKSAIAAFVAAASGAPHDTRHACRCSSPATRKAPRRTARWRSSTGSTSAASRPDMILIGEPTSEHALGDTIKIGRRGSVNMWIDGPRHAGPRRLPAPRRQSDRRAGADRRRARRLGARRGQ